MSLARDPSWPLVLVISLVGCGDDPALRLARSFEALCEQLEVACSENDETFFEDCLGFLWTAAAPLEHVYGEGCVDALASQVECRLAYDCGCSSDDRIWCCDVDNTCTSRPCEEEAAPAGDACGGFYFPLGIGYGGGGGGGGGTGGTAGTAGDGGTGNSSSALFTGSGLQSVRP